MTYAKDERRPPAEPGIGTWRLDEPWVRLSRRDYALACRYIGGARKADLVIMPDGRPYLYRWHVVPRNEEANVYFHIQVLDDPERPLHDHPWDNTSYILSGGYDELIFYPEFWKGHGGCGPDRPSLELRRAPEVIHRKAETAHRLLLAPGQDYTMTLFTTGPKRRAWGFWTEDGRWLDQKTVIENRPDGTSVYSGPLA